MATVTGTPTRTDVGISRRAGRRIGYAVAILVNLALLWIINIWPGWQAAPFVTPTAVDVVPLINASIVVTILANLMYIVVDGTRVKAAGEIVTGLFGVAVSGALLTVFPFDFAAYAFPWEPVVRIVLVVALFGTCVAVLVNLVRLVRGR